MMHLARNSVEEGTPFLGRVLVVDDDTDLCALLKIKLEQAGFSARVASCLSEVRTEVAQRAFDIILLDIFLQREDSLEIIPFLLRESPYAKIVMMSAHGTIQLVVDSIDKGATTFIAKGKNPLEIVRVLRERALVPNEKANEGATSTKHDIIGNSEGVRDVIQKISKVSEYDSTVLVTGESGTGKELVARAIHANSKRSSERFEAINCGAIPENLLESELFGHAKGSFTDAKQDRKGLFEICSGGTLFLDEIGEMPLNLQVKLNRVLQEREIMPLGSGKVVRVATRVVAATNKNLAQEVEAGRFRGDLYYRLAVLKISLPPLSERSEDIPLLINHFLQKFNERFGKQVNPPSREVALRLACYRWPGNIRQLQNAIERAVVLAKDDELSLEDLIPPELEGDQSSGKSADYWLKPFSEAKHGFEQEYLRHLLEVTRGNISEMARISGRYRSDIYRLLSKYEIDWDEFRP